MYAIFNFEMTLQVINSISFHRSENTTLDFWGTAHIFLNDKNSHMTPPNKNSTKEDVKEYNNCSL